MYFCRRFLGLILTGLFVSSLLASADGPKEYNKYKLPLSRSNSEVQPKVLVKSIDQVDIDSVEKGNNFINTYPDSAYSGLVGLHLAKLYFEKGDKEETSETLNWVIENSKSGFRQKYDPIQVTAKYRLAILFLDEGKFNESLAMLETIEDKTSSIYELIGDCYVNLEKNDEAKINYLKALESSPSESIKSIIKMKLSDIN